MAAPLSVLGQARAFARDFPRDKMPPGFLWDVVDYVPLIIDAPLTGRGGWQWGSTVMGGDPVAGLIASFPTGEKLLAIGSDNQWYEVSQLSPYTATVKFAALPPSQNPLQYRDMVISFDATGANVPQLLTAPGGVLTTGAMHATAPKAKVGAVWNDYIVVGGTPGEESIVRYSPVGHPEAAWDTNAFAPTNMPVTAIAAMRAVMIVFHNGQTERIRGSVPPGTLVGQGDLIRELLFGRTGCSDPKTIAYWNDNVIFADEHGCHVTDGAVVRNLVSQGGILYYWRALYAAKVSLAATTFLDFYIITVRTSDGGSTTLVCDLNKRNWYRLSNIYALSMFGSSGTTGMERVFAGMAGTKRLARLGPCFFPVLEVANLADDDGKPVLPQFDTPWYRLGEEARKRIRFAYLSYDLRGLVAGGLNTNPQAEGFAPPPPAPPQLLAALAPALDVSYITSPQQTVYTDIGQLPLTTEYKRYKLPVGKQPYGIAFRVKQTVPTTAHRIFDLEVEAWSRERSAL